MSTQFSSSPTEADRARNFFCRNFFFLPKQKGSNTYDFKEKNYVCVAGNSFPRFCLFSTQNEDQQEKRSEKVSATSLEKQYREAAYTKEQKSSVHKTSCCVSSSSI